MRTRLAAGIVAIGSVAMGQAETERAGGSVNRFGDAMYRQLARTDGNVFFSPYSIHAALSMTLAGARGQTAAEMAEVLQVKDAAEAAKAYAAVMQGLKTARERGGFELNVANSIWGEESVHFFPAFTGMLKSQYASELRTVSYRSNPDGARKQINDWVDQQTKGKIPDLLPAGVLNRDTTMVLANAIYFKAPWQSQFDKGRTEEGDFHATKGKVKAQLMRQKIETRYAEDEQAQVVELPYKGGGTSMIVILPRPGREIAVAEKMMGQTNWGERLGEMERRSVELTLPKWTTRYQADVAGTLKEMGMPRAFSSDADFSGMTTDEALAISNVIHEAFVAVDEQGTEAAAATAVVMMRLSMPMHEDVVEMKVDRPFVYLIRDNESGAMLFAGRVMTPGD